MFRRFLTFLALLALSTSSIDRFAYASAFNPSAAPLKSTKKKKCAPCAAPLENDAKSNPLDKLATLGRRTQVQPFMTVQRHVFDGAPVNFVGTASGHLAFAVTDLELSGAMPLMSCFSASIRATAMKTRDSARDGRSSWTTVLRSRAIKRR